ncbi:hypothetical protein ACYFX5_16620 [Bremerella sp. T1]|uniref:hypothetical protein n=1 Tax=Bremerella sp. TYQ1 TaxID=3119568 RepID=UPI001CC96956|nr:hypothetical protein [Bremerella volcania]UBM34683.1 hypothetical protein LA756_18570 [Bremerella volcania]
MDSSPFASPSLESTAAQEADTSRFLKLAWLQRAILVCALFQSLTHLFLGLFNTVIEPLEDAVKLGTLPTWLPMAYVLSITLFALITIIITTLFLRRLSHATQHEIGWLIPAACQLLPYISIIILLVISYRTSKYFLRNGLSVGMLGISQRALRQQLEQSE